MLNFNKSRDLGRVNHCKTIYHYSNNNITSSQQNFTFIFAFYTPRSYQIPYKLNIQQITFPPTMANREAGQSAYQQQLPPTYPGPVTSTTECTSTSVSIIPHHHQFIHAHHPSSTVSEPPCKAAEPRPETHLSTRSEQDVIGRFR